MTRLLADPVRVDVEVGDLVPGRVCLAGRRFLAVQRVFARWRVEADWWREPVSREYWRLELGGGPVCDLFRDRLRDEWWLSRVYD